MTPPSPCDGDTSPSRIAMGRHERVADTFATNLSEETHLQVSCRRSAVIECN
jgi:hypothetical protein